MQHTTFTEALADVFDKLPEQSIAPDVVEDMLTRAAQRVLDERDMEPFEFTRYVDPEDETTITEIRDACGGEYILLSAEEVALLRSFVMIWDETMPPQAGDPYLTPIETDNGVLKTYQPEESTHG